MSNGSQISKPAATSTGDKLPPSNVASKSADNDVLISAQGEYEVAAEDDLQIHDATKTFPVIEHQLKQMIQSLNDNGQMEPVTVYEGQILDGQKRNLGRRKLGLPLKCRAITDLGGITPLEWVVRKNMAAGTARHLNDSQRALIGAKLCRKVYARPEIGCAAANGFLTKNARRRAKRPVGLSMFESTGCARL